MGHDSFCLRMLIDFFKKKDFLDFLYNFFKKSSKTLRMYFFQLKSFEKTSFYKKC